MQPVLLILKVKNCSHYFVKLSSVCLFASHLRAINVVYFFTPILADLEHSLGEIFGRHAVDFDAFVMELAKVILLLI